MDLPMIFPWSDAFTNVPWYTILASISWSKVLSGTGLLLNMIGVTALTLTDLFEVKPIRTWWWYVWHVDREDLQATYVDPPVNIIGPISGGYATQAEPTSPDDYDARKRYARNHSIATIGLIGGFFFQFLALFV